MIPMSNGVNGYIARDAVRGSVGNGTIVRTLCKQRVRWCLDMSTWRVCVCSGRARVYVHWPLYLCQENLQKQIYLHLFLHKHNLTVFEAYTDTPSFLCSSMHVKLAQY